MNINLKNKKYIISAAGDGIGFKIAKKIISAGGKVFLSDIDNKKIEKIKKNKNYNNKIIADCFDCTNVNEVKKYFKKIKSEKKIDGLINNIGIAGPTENIENIQIDDWESTIKTNLNTHFYYTKYAIPLLKKSIKGSIINLSSTAGIFGFAQRSPYAASKWAIIGLTKTLAIELGKYKIRVNAICPGSVEGDRMKRVVNAKAKLSKKNPKNIKKQFASMVSLETFVTEENIASMALFLLSRESENISGQIISVDGNTERMN